MNFERTSSLRSPCGVGSSRESCGVAWSGQAAEGHHHHQRAFLESRVAIMRGRFLLGPSIANRQAAGVDTGDGGSTCALSRVQ
jgi:hypothetical protein